MVNFNSSYTTNIKVDIKPVKAQKISYAKTYQSNIKPIDFKAKIATKESYKNKYEFLDEASFNNISDNIGNTKVLDKKSINTGIALSCICGISLIVGASCIANTFSGKWYSNTAKNTSSLLGLGGNGKSITGAVGLNGIPFIQGAVSFSFLSDIWDYIGGATTAAIGTLSSGAGYIVDIFDRDKKAEKYAMPLLSFSDGYWGQGMTFNGSHFVMARSDADGNIKIITADTRGNIINEFSFPSNWLVDRFGIDGSNHVNDLTYNSTENCYYLSTNTDAGIFKFNFVSNKDGKVSLNVLGQACPGGSSGICYDVTTNQYYSVDGDWVTVLNEKMVVVQLFKKANLPGDNQGIEAYDGKLLTIRDKTGGCAIDVYNASTGELLETYTVSTVAEPEAISWSGETDKFYLYSNQGGIGTTMDVVTLEGLSDL